MSTLTPTCYIITPISTPPEKDGVVILLDEKDLPDGGEFRDGKFYYWNHIAADMIAINEKYGYRWLRPLDLSTLLGECWNAAAERIANSFTQSFHPEHFRDKDTYINNVINPQK
jgi:hypothetical protein